MGSVDAPGVLEEIRVCNSECTNGMSLRAGGWHLRVLGRGSIGGLNFWGIKTGKKNNEKVIQLSYLETTHIQPLFNPRRSGIITATLLMSTQIRK